MASFTLFFVADGASFFLYFGLESQTLAILPKIAKICKNGLINKGGASRAPFASRFLQIFAIFGRIARVCDSRKKETPSSLYYFVALRANIKNK